MTIHRSTNSYNFGTKFFQTGDNITAHINFCYHAPSVTTTKGNRSRLTLLQRCSTHTMTCRIKFIRIPLSPPFPTASRATDNLVPPLTLWINFQFLSNLSPRAHLILLSHSTSFSDSILLTTSHLSFNLHHEPPCCVS